MSHFTVVIFGEKPEEQLAPYSESDKKYMKFVDKTDEVVSGYETDMIDEFFCSSHSSWGAEITKELFDKISEAPIGREMEYEVPKLGTFSYFTKNCCYRGYFTIEDGKRCEGDAWLKVVDVIETTHPDDNICFTGKIRIAKIAPPQEIPVSTKYGTIDDYATDYHGYKKEGEKYGYLANENAKWDWYELGGRWTGEFKLKAGAKGLLGKPGLMTDPASIGTADQTIKKNIDFDAMHQEKFESSMKTYDEFEALLKTNPEEAQNKAYWEYGIENIGDRNNWVPEDRKAYLNRHAGFAPFAFVKDGIWYEKGNMGWFGISSKDKEPEQWSSEFHKILEEIPDDMMISLYDCHI